jgi:hypothetical protein
MWLAKNSGWRGKEVETMRQSRVAKVLRIELVVVFLVD